ncbi:MAG: GNAT family N-acetyltransferase [Actinobacteria bacterium HGW-Actinobacteria-1]|jgi:putative acetyltransferase|nr:MAG: GNAT family N-acetyltransferase [Actinobacteria bacterium HGW-Actinobacteria-1]
MSKRLIRAESDSDISGIREVNIEAFADHPISQHTEHLIVDALRADGALAVSLVAIEDGRVLGHVAFSRAVVGNVEGDWYLLGPLAVLPTCQGQGIGSALVEAGLSAIRTHGAAGCVLVGDSGYYGRFGFATFSDLEYEGVPHEYVLGLQFADAEPSGCIRAHDAFLIEPEPDGGSA